MVDKPPAWTSHDVVEAARAWFGTRRVGHLGTLDPLATGVLPLAIREATKLIPFLPPGPKRYQGIVRLGVETDTLDAEGEVVRRHAGLLPDAQSVRGALAARVGESEQVPPMYSSVKRSGVPLYRLARRGEVVEREPRKVRIERIECLGYAPPDLELDVVCSPGTFVRALAADLGHDLGCGAHVVTLRRTLSHPFGIAQAASVEALEAEARAGRVEARLVPPAQALGLPTLRLSGEALRRVSHGGDVVPPPGVVLDPGARAVALAEDGTPIALLELRADRRLRPLRVLAIAAPG